MKTAEIRVSFIAAVMLSIALMLGLAMEVGATPIKNPIGRGQAVENERQNCQLGDDGIFSSVEGTGANAGATFTWCDSADGTRACKITAKTVECTAKTTIVSAPTGPVVKPTIPVRR